MIIETNEEVELKIRFGNQKVLDYFVIWLAEMGEQQYWEWMEHTEQDETGDITVTEFDYHGKNGDKFLEDNIIRTTSGRLDDDDKEHQT